MTARKKRPPKLIAPPLPQSAALQMVVAELCTSQAELLRRIVMLEAAEMLPKTLAVSVRLDAIEARLRGLEALGVRLERYLALPTTVKMKRVN